MQKGEKQHPRFRRSKRAVRLRSVQSARSLEVCDSRGFQFVAKLARICHSCSHPLVLATRQNLKKSHHLRDQKIARVAAALRMSRILFAAKHFHWRKMSDWLSRYHVTWMSAHGGQHWREILSRGPQHFSALRICNTQQFRDCHLLLLHFFNQFFNCGVAGV